MNKEIKELIKSSIDVKSLILLDEDLISNVQRASELLVQTFQSGNKVLFCGNGGSAADAQHLAAEFSGRFYIDRKSLPSEALHCNTSYLTAVANDYSYDQVYARLLEGVSKPGDVLIGISTSGNSRNIINAFKVANCSGVKTIALTGESGGVMRNYSDILINVPSSDTPRVQESHILIGHIMCQLVEEILF